ncbi:MAG: hypothetical protein FWC85_00250 [Elusimicrobia bacterium]|nr:hypothetical protein [Elusimicrobiota bacterium]
MKAMFLVLALGFLSGCAGLAHLGVISEPQDYQAQHQFNRIKARVIILEAEVEHMLKQNKAYGQEIKTVRSEQASFEGRNEFLRQEIINYRLKSQNLERFIRQHSRNENDEQLLELASDLRNLQTRLKLYEIEIAGLRESNRLLENRAWALERKKLTLQEENFALQEE